MPTVFYAGNALDRDCGGRVGDVVSVRGVRTCRFTGTGVWLSGYWRWWAESRPVAFCVADCGVGGAMWLLFVMTGYFPPGETGRLVWGIVVRGRGGSVCRNRAICRDMAGV